MASRLKAVMLLTVSISCSGQTNAGADAPPAEKPADPAETALTSAAAKGCIKLKRTAFEQCVADAVKELSAIDANYVEWELRKARQEVEEAPRLRAAEAKRISLLETCHRKGYRAGIAYIGMTREQLVTCGLGKPDKINAIELRGSYQEQYVYDRYGYVYLHNGLVDAIQTTR